MEYTTAPPLRTVNEFFQYFEINKTGDDRFMSNTHLINIDIVDLN